MSATDRQSELIEGRWGMHPIERRKTQLAELLRKWKAESNHGTRLGPFDGEWLSGSDVFWLVINTTPHINARLMEVWHKGEMERTRPGGRPSPFRSSFDGEWFSGSDVFWLASGTELNILRAPVADILRGINLPMLHLEGANLTGAHLERAYLTGAHLEGANLTGARLEGAVLDRVHLEGAVLDRAHLEGTRLEGAQLEGANLYRADLRDADLAHAYLGGTISHTGRVLSPANLEGATFDARTNLAGVILGDIEHGFVSVVDTAWNGVNLANVAWEGLCSPEGQLGDEQSARNPTKDLETTLSEYRAAVRAYRQLSVALQAQGLTEQSVWLGYRGQMLQHTVLTLQLASRRQTPRQGSWRRRALEMGHLWGRVLFSRVLDRVAGYGYKPGKSITSYLLMQLTFIALYLLIGLQNFVATGHHLPAASTPPQAAWTALLEAGILSVTSFHGRAFLPGSTGNFVNNVPLPTTLMFGGAAAVEAVIGLLIEAILVASLIQRYFR